MLAQRQTSVAADLAIWRCASPLTLPWADVTLEFTFISMPTSRAVTVSTVTLSMACNHDQGEGREKFRFRVFRFFIKTMLLIIYNVTTTYFCKLQENDTSLAFREI